MLLGKVIGTVVASRKEESVEGLKLLVVRGLDEKMDELADLVVCADGVGAGVGEVVLFAQGSAARQTLQTQDRPVDGVIMAIVDIVEVGGEVRYKKE